MKEFLIKTEYPGKLEFIDDKEGAVFELLLSHLKKQGVASVKLTISEIDKNITDKQKNLFKVLCSKVSNSSGYTISEVEENLVNKYDRNKTSINQLSKEEFSDFFIFAMGVCDEFFGIKITIGKDGLIKELN